MEQLILHGIGDYFIQTDKWALNKKRKGGFGFYCCFMHCFTYSIPFLLIGSYWAFLAIFISHFIIDRTRVIDILLAVKNNVKTDGKYDISNMGFALNKPAFMSVWLYIITDNILHIICNYLAIKYL